MITDLSSGQEGWLAKKDLTTGPRVGSYVVVSEDLEKIGVAGLERSMEGAANLVIVDEIGPMEMTSTSFRNSISRVLNGNKAVGATVKYGSGYPEVEKMWQKSVHWEITKENRESIYGRIVRQVDDWIRNRESGPLESLRRRRCRKGPSNRAASHCWSDNRGREARQIEDAWRERFETVTPIREDPSLQRDSDRC